MLQARGRLFTLDYFRVLGALAASTVLHEYSLHLKFVVDLPLKSLGQFFLLL